MKNFTKCLKSFGSDCSLTSTFKPARAVFMGQEAPKKAVDAPKTGAEPLTPEQLQAKQQELKDKAVSLSAKVDELKDEQNPAIRAKAAEAQKLIDSVNNGAEGRVLNAGQIQANLSKFDTLISFFEKAKQAVEKKTQIERAMDVNKVNARGDMRAIYDEFLSQHSNLDPEARLQLDKALQEAYADVDAEAKLATFNVDAYVKQVNLQGLDAILQYAKTDDFTRVTLLPLKTEFRAEVTALFTKDAGKLGENAKLYVDTAVWQARQRLQTQAKTDPDGARTALGELNVLQQEFLISLAETEAGVQKNPKKAAADRARILQNFQGAIDSLSPQEQVSHTDENMRARFDRVVAEEPWVVGKPTKKSQPNA